MTDEATLAYLTEVLALDPAEQSGRIMELRAARTGAAQGRNAAQARDDERQRARAAIEDVRSEFWALDAETAEARLDALELDEFPDLARARAHLLRVSELRSEADALADDDDADWTLTTILCRVLIAPSAEAARLREKATRDCARADRYAAGKQFVAIVRRNHPGIAAVEADWLARLVRAKKDKKDSAAIKGGLGCLGTYVLISFGIRIVRAVIEWFEGL